MAMTLEKEPSANVCLSDLKAVSFSCSSCVISIVCCPPPQLLAMLEFCFTNNVALVVVSRSFVP